MTVLALSPTWSLWSTACLRSAGFPARLVLELADPELLVRVDELLARERAAMVVRKELIAQCRRARELDPTTVSFYKRAVQKILRDLVPEPFPDPEAERARLAFAGARDEVASTNAKLRAAYEATTSRTSLALRACARDDRFRAALLWQNRTAVESGLDVLLRREVGAHDSKTRAGERLIASYIQRYCAKNDTIGFFGPCGWASLTTQPDAVVQRPGPTLTAASPVFFEYWAIDALARRLSQDPALRPWLAPRLLPRYRLDGEVLHYPIEKTAQLGAELAAVAALCDGSRSAKQIARELASSYGEADVLEMIEELRESKLVLWELEVATADPHPERRLAAALARIEEPASRAHAEAALEQLTHQLALVAGAASVGELDAALDQLGSTFTGLTDTATERAHGETYAGRTPIYQECVRDLELVLGEPVRALLVPLELVLQSARWFTHEIAARYRSELVARYEQLSAKHGAVIDFATYWDHVRELFPGANASGSIVGAVRAELHARWTTLLALPHETTSPIARTYASLVDQVSRVFAAPGPGWPSARHQSPDVMFAARDAEAFARGEALAVLGELHAGFNTILGPFLKLHPEPERLVADRDAEIGRPGIAQVWTKAISNADYYSPSPLDLDLENGDTLSTRPRSSVISVGELVVERLASKLTVRTRDQRHAFEVIPFFEHQLIAESFAAFSLLPALPHNPRITIDKLVIARETWRLVPGELAWLAIEAAADKFVAARRWASELGLPRWVFARTPEEIKPVFVDFASPIYVEMLAKMLRGAAAVTLSEMLPDLDHTWIVDAAGDSYTSELRIAALDREAWSEPTT